LSDNLADHRPHPKISVGGPGLSTAIESTNDGETTR
jgi:hypothetical protein